MTAPSSSEVGAGGKGIDKTLLASSHRTSRILGWIFSLPAGLLLSALCAWSRMPDAPWWLVGIIGLVLWPMLGFLFDRLVVLQSEAFDAVFSGDLEACRQVLAKRTRSWGASLDLHGTAALDLALGDVRSAQQRLASLPKARIGPAVWMAKLSQSHVLVMSPNPYDRARVLPALLQVRPSRAWGRRYRAYLLAQAALHEPIVFVDVNGVRERDPRALLEHDALCRRAAEEIRAYGDPVAVHFARFIEAARRFDGVKGELPRDLRVSAMLARGYGVAPIAEELDARATAEERAEKGPYRA